MRKIDAHSLMRVFREHEPIIYAEDESGYDRGAMDMWKLLYAAVKAAPTLPDKGKEDKDESKA